MAIFSTTRKCINKNLVLSVDQGHNACVLNVVYLISIGQEETAGWKKLSVPSHSSVCKNKRQTVVFIIIQLFNLYFRLVVLSLLVLPVIKSVVSLLLIKVKYLFLPLIMHSTFADTLSPPAVKTQWLSQCHAFQRLVRSSHTLVNWTFDLLNRFSNSLASLWKHWMLFTSVCNTNTSGQWKESIGQTSQSLCSSFSGRISHKCDFGAEPRSRIIATSAVKGLTCFYCSDGFVYFNAVVFFLLKGSSWRICVLRFIFNPFAASCKNALSLSEPGVPAPCEKFPHSSQLNFE
jgi:hypothetical protein